MALHPPAPVAPGTALPLAVLASAATYGVAQVATGLDSGLLRSLFGVFLILIALRMLAGNRKAGSADGAGYFNRKWLPLVGIPGGACMGLLGVGGGLLATPIFTQAFGQRQTVAQSLSLVLVTPCSAVALLTYGRAHQVDWSIGLPMAIGGLLTVSTGVAVAHRLPERSMRLAFAWMILITALWMLLKPLILQGPY
ncbi:MAG TPA: sulfite exporter TauE/SafE family protein [Zoogloea sp.]|nr:sulfite exporter TauE/SafE family protein [Zoogloea sp.]